jgi:predicted ester cyclase
MTTEETRSIVKRFANEFFNDRGWGLASALYAPGLYFHPPRGDALRTPAAVVEYYQELLRAFPDLTFTIGDVIAEGDNACVEIKLSGTHKGAYAGHKASGRSFRDAESWIILHTRGGQIVEQFVFPFARDLLVTLGLVDPVPPPRLVGKLLKLKFKGAHKRKRPFVPEPARPQPGNAHILDGQNPAARQAILTIMLDMFNSRRWDMVDELLPEDAVYESAFGRWEGHKGVLERVGGTVVTTFPDISIEPLDIIVDGDRAALHARVRATQGGPMDTIPATYRRCHVRDLNIFRLRDDKVVTLRHLRDFEGVQNQLGLGGIEPAPLPLRLLFKLGRKLDDRKGYKPKA